VDVKPQTAGGTHYNLEVHVTSPERGLMGFGCDLLPASIRSGFSGAGLSENAIASLKTSGYAASKDEQGTTASLHERRLILEKKGESPFHVVYRWPDNQAFLNRAFWHQTKAVSTSEVRSFLGSWIEGWDFYRPWQTVGIGECAARFAFPTTPECGFIVGTDNFVTRCTATSGAGQPRFVVECMIQKDDTEENEAATFKALDQGISLARTRAFGGSAVLNNIFVESARSAVPNLWVRGRRHSLRSNDGRQHRETLIAARQATIYALWVEWEEGAIPPAMATIQRFFDRFGE